jgi:hypothetical protein
VRAAKRDDNERAIVDALRAAGCRVQQITQGDGVPDLLVGVPSTISRPARFCMLEVKDGDKPASAQRLTPQQERWHESYRHLPVFVVRSVDEALEVIRDLP